MRSDRTRWALALAPVAGAFLLVLPGQLRNQGPPMEEGFMLVFPELVLRGSLPNADFLHLYGPGSVWVLAGVFEVFGVSLTAERLVGLAQQLGVVSAVVALAAPWGRTAALWCGLCAAMVIIPPIGLTALAYVGGVALGAWGVRVALGAAGAPLAGDPARARRLALVGGVLGGIALLYRPDLVVAVVAGGIGAGAVLDRGARVRLLGGLVAGASPYVIHLALVGPAAAFRGMVLDPVVYLRGGRRLPIPPDPFEVDGFLQRAGDIDAIDWPVPALPTAMQLTLWFFVLPGAVAVVAVTGRWLLRRDRGSRRGRTLWAAGLFCAGMVPQGIQRVDATHFAWASCIVLGLVPLAVIELVRARRTAIPSRRLATWCGAGTLVALLAALPHFTARTYTDYAARTFGVHRLAYGISHGGRTFYYGRADVPAALRPLFADVDRVTEAGQKVFVGPSDLRYTPYVDAFVYHLLLPDLEPSTYFIEMDPGVANRAGSGLADDVRAADIVILSSVWADWDEPNDSRTAGPDDANQVVRDDFCLVDRYGDGEGDRGLFELYERCTSRP